MMPGYLLLYPVIALCVPLLLLGIVRKTKARLQNRVGAPVYQPFLDMAKLFRKGQVVSEHASCMLKVGSALCLSVCVLLAVSTPWLGPIQPLVHLDVFSFIYLLVFVRIVTLLIAIDTNSPFGGFGASRETLLSVLVEPGVMLCLISLAVMAGSTDLVQVFSFSGVHLAHRLGLWILSGCGLFIASLVELSRMPADDPTTHLELTMVHEAMILENSGANLAFVEFAAAIKMAVLLGISAQCFVHAIQPLWSVPYYMQALVSVIGVVSLAMLVAFIESSFVKLRWTKLPDFIGYSVGFGLLSMILAVGG
jgi:formate hydrogenlyase subunit 4